MISKAFRLARALSLDIVIGAVIGSLFLADYMQVELPIISILALAVCVWLIYTVDHLSDAHKIPHTAHTFRHQLHQKHFKTLSYIALFVSGLSMIILVSLPLKLILWGSIVLSFVGLYFLSIRWLKVQNILPKEFVIAILYGIGVFLAPLYISNALPSTQVWLLFAQYSLLALCNLLLFSWYEKELDQLDLHISFTTLMGDKTSIKIIRKLIWLLYLITGTGVIFYHSDTQFLFAQLIIFWMSITLHCILLFPYYFKKYERYRTIADAIFLYPLFYLIL